MAERKRFKPRNPGEVAPMVVLGDRFRERFPDQPDPSFLWTQLGVPTDLRYLNDGLSRSRQTLNLHADELTLCLEGDAPHALTPSKLLLLSDHMQVLIAELGMANDDPKAKVMARLGPNDHHPLNGFCLGALHHWANLFYTLEPAVVANFGTRHDSYEELMTEFAVYVIAGYSRQLPERYLKFCTDWWDERALPAVSPLPAGELPSRVGAASRAMRRITLMEHQEVFTALSNHDRGARFHQRLYRALKSTRWSEADRTLLHHIALLLELVRPGWHRPGGTERKAPETRGRGTARRKFLDGFVRLAESNAIVMKSVTDEGLIVERVQLETEDAPTDGGDDEWVPIRERGGRPLIEAVEMEDEESEAPVGMRPLRSHFVEQQIRRSHYAHALARNRLTASDIAALRQGLAAPPPSEALAPLIGLLHASFAIGRSLDAVRPLRIATTVDPTTLQQGDLQYSLPDRSWLIRVAPPAWIDSEVTAEERPLSTVLVLPDCTGFGDWMLKYLPDVRDQTLPVVKLTAARSTCLLEWLTTTTGDTHARFSACAQYLFHRLLEVTNGDIGVASLITGVAHTHSSSVGHYAHYRLPKLVGCYREAHGLKAGASSTATGQSSGGDEDIIGIGAKRVPTLQAVQKLIAFLLDRALRAEAAHERHNYFTAYTLAGLVVGIGLRPVGDAWFRDIDPAVWLGTFVDKARTDYHRRVSALPPLLGAHLEEYADYLRAMNFGSAGWTETSTAYWYRDDAHSDWRAIRPRDFEALAAPVYGLELYSLRRFARTMLAEDATVTGEDLDAFMGHWFDRVSPHDALSTYPARRLPALAEGPANQLLAQIGFKPLKRPG